MQSPSIFTRIIRGELPSHKIYEDDHVFALLNIHPSRPGHTLVVPKVEVDAFYDLSPTDYTALMRAVQKVAVRQAEVFGSDYRICLKIAGFDVPHAHVHVIPCRDGEDFKATEDQTSEPDHVALAEMARRLAF